MDKIDCLGWAAGVAFVSYGLRVGIRVSSPEIMDRVPVPALPGGMQKGTRNRGDAIPRKAQAEPRF